MALVSPASALVLGLEGLATHLLAVGVARAIHRSRATDVLFDRSRFLAFLVLGLAVRGLTEGVVLPVVGIAWQNVFGGLGLLLVPLVAERIWEDGARDAAGPILGPTLVAILLGHLVLQPLGAWDAVTFAAVYGYGLEAPLEPLGTALFLVAAAFVVAAVNSRRGFEENGVLLPILLGLAWLHPVGLLVAVLVATLVATTLRALAHRPLLASISLGGSRGALLTLLGVLLVEGVLRALPGASPALAAGDLLGFGHLVAPMLAWRMREQGLTPAARPALGTSLQGLVGGFLLLGSLALLVPSPGEGEALETPRFSTDAGDLDIRLAFDRWKVQEGGPEHLFRADTERIARAVRQVEAGLRQPRGEERDRLLDRAAGLLEPVGLRVTRYRDRPMGRTVAILSEPTEEPEDLAGRGIACLGANPTADVTLVVPPDAGPAVTGVATALFRQGDARALLVRPSWSGRAGAGQTSPFTTVDACRTALEGSLLVECRLREEGGPRWRGPAPPRGFLFALRRWGGGVEIEPGPGPARLSVDLVTARRIRASALGAVAPPLRSGDASIAAHLLDSERRPGRQGAAPGRDGGRVDRSETTAPPDRGAARFLRHAVIEPLIELRRTPGGAAIDDLSLVPIAGAAAWPAIGCELERYRYTRTGEDHLILRSRPGSPFRGLLVTSLDPGRELVLVASNPVSERYTWDAAIRLFELLDARAVVIAGGEGPDGRRSLAREAVRAFLELSPSSRPLVAEVRGFEAAGGAAEVDVVVSTGRERPRRSEVPRAVLDLVDALRGVGTVRFFDGSRETAFIETPTTAIQDMAWAADARRSAGLIWLSRRFREGLRAGRGRSAVRTAARALEIETVSGSLIDWSRERLASRRRTVATPDPTTGAVVSSIIAELTAYLERRHVAWLARAVDRARGVAAELVLLHDESQDREYLVLVPPPRASQVLFVGSLALRAGNETEVDPTGTDAVEALETFRRRNDRSILFEVGR